MGTGSRGTRPAAVGMMFGVWIGGGVGVLGFALAQDPIWFVLTGLGAALGLGIGAAVESRRGDGPEEREPG